MTICAHTRTRPDSRHTPAIREAHVVVPAAATRLPLSEHPITFNKSDQPEHSVDVGRFLLIVSAVLETVLATKVFMDGGSDSNLIYWDTFEKQRSTWTNWARQGA